VKGADDVRDHRLGGVIDAAALTLFWIVFSQKSLVEVDDRVGALALMEELVEDAAHVSHREHFGDVIYAALQLARKLPQGDKPKEITEDADGVGDSVERGPAVELLAGPDPGGKETISDGLSVEVSEAFQCEAGDEEILERLVETQKRASAAGLFLGEFFGHYLVPQEPCPPG